MYNDNVFVRQGWQCPICKRVYSPDTSMCAYCGGELKSYATTDITIGYFSDEDLEKLDEILHSKCESADININETK